jgi:hypothetical protein
MKRLMLGAIALGALTLAACTTTEEANVAMQSRWIGQPADSFFTFYGPPASSFPLSDGGEIFTWVGGETTRHIPAQYSTPASRKDDDFGKVTKTKTETHQTSDGRTITKTTSSSFGLVPAAPAAQLISPARTEQLYCELQITVGPDNIIRMLRATNDTNGEGLSFSRCAEVLGVKKS